MPSSAKRHTKAEEAAMRAAGLVPTTIWVLDVNAPGFDEEYRRQVRLLAEADAKDPTIDSFLDAAWGELNAEISRSEK